MKTPINPASGSCPIIKLVSRFAMTLAIRICRINGRKLKRACTIATAMMAAINETMMPVKVKVNPPTVFLFSLFLSSFPPASKTWMVLCCVVGAEELDQEGVVGEFEPLGFARPADGGVGGEGRRHGRASARGPALGEAIAPALSPGSSRPLRLLAYARTTRTAAIVPILSSAASTWTGWA